MANVKIGTALKYADLQMAAEALYDLDSTLGPVAPKAKYSGRIESKFLTTGNNHASKFVASEADKFAGDWEVREHVANSKTGFSGTLFRAIRDNEATGVKKGELVLSFRSTEFIDDAARDNQGTNKMEIKAFGWAFGQIDDMESWYASLRERQLIPDGARYAVTGYSLGGHLATAFNLLRRQDQTQQFVDAVYTFNGAGVGNRIQGALAAGSN